MYQILGDYRGEATLVGSDASAAKAFGYYKAAARRGSLPVTALRITDPDGIEIGPDELQRRAEAEART